MRIFTPKPQNPKTPKPQDSSDYKLIIKRMKALVFGNDNIRENFFKKDLDQLALKAIKAKKIAMKPTASLMEKE